MSFYTTTAPCLRDLAEVWDPKHPDWQKIKPTSNVAKAADREILKAR